MGRMGSTILQSGRNVWRVEPAARATVLVDGASFFAAVRKAFLNAQRSIFIVGWDIDSRVRLAGVAPDDGYPLLLSDFLTALVQERPELEVYVLLWDFSIIYAGQRELFPRLSLQWQTPSRVTLCLDDAVPFGSSQHQKLIVIDDALAFSGGLDLTLRRWDTPEHNPHEPARVDASDRTYPPFHDVQMMVDGEAAHALAMLARRRWCRAKGTEPAFAPVGDPWPKDVQADFTDVRIGIARTEPAFNGQGKVSEVERLFHNSIECAQESIYIENQFISSLDIAKHLAQRLRERPKLEIVTVSPRSYTSWVVTSTLGSRRGDFVQLLRQAGGKRVRMTYPCVDDGRAVVDTMVHSKVMVIDDKVLRVGSANLNNRSMGVDTECDLVIEAHNDADRAAIRRVRNQLLGDHCGVDADTVASMLGQHGSLIAAADRLSAYGHQLCPLELSETEPPGEISAMIEGVVDPKQPLSVPQLWKRMRDKAPTVTGTALAIIAVLMFILVLTVAWHLTPISEFVTGGRLNAMLASISESAWAPLWILLAYLIGGAIAFPVTILIIATVTVFGPWLGFLYALVGMLASASLMYGMGAWLGRDTLRTTIGPRWEKVRREIDNRGVLAVAAIRLIPVAPFTFINLISGACSIAFVDYLAGTFIGALPGLTAISLLGREITSLLTDLSLNNVVRLALALLVWIAVVWAAQKAVTRLRERLS